MKLAICNDLHTEFGDITLHNDQQADVLILGGDICTIKSFKKKPKERLMIIDFFDNCAAQFSHVVYVCGNHEFYDGDIATGYDILKRELSRWPNIHLLEKETWVHDDVTFVAGTLWTDMNKSDSLTMWHCGQRMNDFQLIKNSNRMTHHKNVIYAKNPDGSGMHLKDSEGNLVVERIDHYEKASRWSAEDSVEDHKKMVDYIDIVTQDKTKKYVVVTHHAPSSESIAECYKGDTLMNGAFRSDLSEFIMDRPQIKLWTHGHMHNNSNYWVGDTRVVCNPRGYIKYESIANFFQLQYMEV
jgi:Icc-related predicted phosphoesterase